MTKNTIEITRDINYLQEPVRWSDWLDFLARFENELQRKEVFWRNMSSDPQGIAFAVMVAMAETAKAMKNVNDEVAARKSNATSEAQPK